MTPRALCGATPAPGIRVSSGGGRRACSTAPVAPPARRPARRACAASAQAPGSSASGCSACACLWSPPDAMPRRAMHGKGSPPAASPPFGNGRRMRGRRAPPAASAAAGGDAGIAVREVLTRSQRTKLDESDDRRFYDLPRFVKHVDEGFLAQVTELYRQRIPEGGVVLDLCSSWVSHLPPEKKFAEVIGHGLNAAELARNDRLDRFFVRNLNKEPRGWALEDKSVDAVLVCVSVQYWQQPERVMEEIYRVLRPGGVVIITFSNRMFYDKAISAWRDASGYARSQLVKQYISCVPGFTEPEALTGVRAADGSTPSAASGLPAPLRQLAQLFTRASSDPLYAVIAYRNFRAA